MEAFIRLMESIKSSRREDGSCCFDPTDYDAGFLRECLSELQQTSSGDGGVLDQMMDFIEQELKRRSKPN